MHLREREDFCRDNKWNMNAVNRGSSLTYFVAHRQKAWTDWREIGQSSVKMLQLYYSLKIVILHSLIKCVTVSTVKHAVVTCNLLPAGNLFVQHFVLCINHIKHCVAWWRLTRVWFPYRVLEINLAVWVVSIIQCFSLFLAL